MAECIRCLFSPCKNLKIIWESCSIIVKMVALEGMRHSEENAILEDLDICEPNRLMRHNRAAIDCRDHLHACTDA